MRRSVRQTWSSAKPFRLLQARAEEFPMTQTSGAGRPNRAVPIESSTSLSRRRPSHAKRSARESGGRFAAPYVRVSKAREDMISPEIQLREIDRRILQGDGE